MSDITTTAILQYRNHNNRIEYYLLKGSGKNRKAGAMDFTNKYTDSQEEKIMLRKIDDLIRRSERSFTVLYSHFLTPAEQMLIGRVTEFYGIISFDGGYEDAERRMCRVCTAEYEADEGAPLELFRAVSTAPEANWSHRDVLGSLMGLGIKREMIGDIIMLEREAMFFCDRSVSDYVNINLEKIGRYKVKLSKTELSDISQPETVKKSVNISSPRLDCVCAECFGLSRTKAADAIRKGLVSVDWQPCENVSRELRGGEKISLRGKGKVRYLGITGTSKKGISFAEIEKYI